MSKSDLLQQARGILKNNDFGTNTRPAPRLYPHQWLWDSCFVAIGLRHDDPERAIAEIESLFRGQWKNGMLPHMIFAEGIEYHAGPDMWGSKDFDDAPENVQTSCMTQPPMVAEAIIKVGEKLDDTQRKEFYSRNVERLAAHHAWLYRERDSEETGLVTLIHAWECGTEDAPYWAKAMEASAPDEVIKARELGSFAELDAKRPDLKHAPLDQRPSSADFYSLYHTFELIKGAKFDLSTAKESTKAPLIRDVFFNAILGRANQCLARIAEAIDYQLPAELVEAARRTDSALQTMLENSDEGRLYSLDYRTDDPLQEASLANLMAIYGCNMNASQTASIVAEMTAEKYWPKYGVTTVPTDSQYYSELRFWQGPVWVNTNWLLIEGLKRQGQLEVAKRLTESTVMMVQDKESLYEYYSAKSSKPAGTHSFSWSAALVIDLLEGSSSPA